MYTVYNFVSTDLHDRGIANVTGSFFEARPATAVPALRARGPVMATCPACAAPLADADADACVECGHPTARAVFDEPFEDEDATESEDELSDVSALDRVVDASSDTASTSGRSIESDAFDAPRPSHHESKAATLQEVEDSVSALRLLYLVHLYTGRGDAWIRELPILVLVYEGIISSGQKNCFEYDYAPALERVYGSAPRYMNISEEGRDDLDDLRELGLITALKVTSETYDHSTLLRISAKGTEFLSRVISSGTLDAASRRCVEALTGYPDHFLEVRYDVAKSSFYLHDTNPSVRDRQEPLRSSITDVEDVPYVSSAYVPPHFLSSPVFAPDPSKGFRKARRILRVEGMSEFEQKNRAIRDSHLDENVLLDDVRVLFCEYVPMGSNEMVAFCATLGTGERMSGGLFCGEVSHKRHHDMVVGVDRAKLTKLKVLDADDVRYANVEADLLMTATASDVKIGGVKTNQIENFGINFRENGVVTYGFYVNGVADRIRESISVDLLARMLSDLHEDSSVLVANLFSDRQRAMLDKTFKGEPDNRERFVCVIAERATPKLKAADYMDGEAIENEIKQIIGATYFAQDLNEQEVFVLGSRGVLIFGPRSERHHKILAAYSELQARSLFIKNVFSSCFALSDALKKTRALIDDYQSDPLNFKRIRARLAEHMSTVTILHAVQKFVLESLDSMDVTRERLSDVADVASQTLYEALTFEDSCARLKRRAFDLEKVIDGCWNDLASLQEMTHVIGIRRKAHIKETIEGTTKSLEDAFRAQARNSTTLEITQVILSGSLAFDILDRFTGQYLSLEVRWVMESLFPYFINVPMIWLIVNMLTWALVAVGLLWFMRKVKYMNCSVETKRITLNKPIRVSRWRRFVASRKIDSTAFTEDKGARVVKYGWTEPSDKKWRGSPPKLEIVVDERYGFVLQASVVVNKRTCKLTAETIWRRIWSDIFIARNIYDDSREFFDDETGSRADRAVALDDSDDERSGARAARRSGGKPSGGDVPDTDSDDASEDELTLVQTGELTFDEFAAERSRSERRAKT